MVNLLSAFKVHPDPFGNLPPKETVNARIIALALFGSCAAVLFGYDLGFIGGVVTLPAFKTDFDLDTKSAKYVTNFSSNVVSVFQAGAVFGSMCAVYFANKYGRRMCLIGNMLIYLVGAAFMTGATGPAGLGLMYAGRVLTGWGVGASTMLVPVYVAECSPAHIRGRLVGMYEVGVQFGTMIGFWIPYGVLKTKTGTPQWRIPCALQIIPAALSLVGLFFLTETPRFVAQKKGEEQALQTLVRLRGLPQDHTYIHEELTAIMVAIEHERENGAERDPLHTIKKSFGPGNFRILMSGVLVMIFFQMAGTNAVNYYSPRIFAQMGLSASSAKLFATGVYGVVRFVSTLIAMVVFTDRFGRKTMIVAGGSVMALCMWTIGAIQKTHPLGEAAATGPGAAQYASIVLIFVWAVAFCFSYAGIPWIYCAEIFPLDIRTFCMAVCTSVHWLFNLMLAKTTPFMIENLGGYGIYFVFAACTTVGAVYEWFFMPETRGKALEDIQGEFYPELQLREPSIRRASVSSGDVSEKEKEAVAHVESAVSRV